MDYIIKTKDGELYHYGVPGMRWGHRKYTNADGSLNKAGKARQAYKDSKAELKTANKELRTANKALRKSAWTAMGRTGIDKYKNAETAAKKAQKAASDAYANTVAKKAKFKASTSKNAEKAEYKVYKKAMSKFGIRDSAADTSSGGKSTAIYNKAKAAKGKEYADKLEKRVQNEAVATFVAGVGLSVGGAFVSAYLQNRG